MIYLVTAYRYGFTDDTYPVWVGPDRQEAESRAKREWDSRGDKYAVEVAECVEGPEEMEFKRVHYIPSAMGESGPSENHGKDTMETLGCFVWSAAIDRCIYVPDGKSTYLVKTEIEPPDWLLRKVADLKERLDYNQTHP